MRDSFGARLRRHREDRGVSLADIAEQTKIKVSLLDGLERDDISQWPAGIFRRAYVRAYAAAIGFDADTAIREFLTIHPDPIEAPEPASSQGTGIRGLFGSFRRRTTPPIPTPPQTAHGVAATVGTRAPEPAVAPAARAEPPVAAPPPSSQAPAPPPVGAAPPEGSDLDFRIEKPKPTPEKGGGEVLLAAAKVCTELGRVDAVEQVLPLLEDAAKILGARGLIVWVWSAATEELEPALVHGYSAKVRARLRGVKPTADNLTAAAYRAAAPLATTGALAVPLLVPAVCAGVLAIEVEDGREQDVEVRALATLFAAILAQLVAVPAIEQRHADPDSEPAQPLAAHSG